MFRSFRFKNFRGFRDLTFDSLERINLIAGQNNTGKTALLEAIFLHIGANNPELGPRINSWRGIQRFKADIEDVWGSLFLGYDTDTAIELSSQDDEGVERTLQISLTDASTSRIDQPNGKDLADAISTGTFTREVKLEYRDSTGQSVVSHGVVIDGEIHSQRGKLHPATLGFFLITRYQNPVEDSDRFSELAVQGAQDQLTSILTLVEPRLRQLSIQLQGKVAMVHGDIGVGRLLPIAMMGEGMSRLLSLSLGITTFRHGVVLIDEVENGLHYSVMSKVWSALAQAARAADVQIFATTHSWECICAAHEAFSASEIYDFRLHRLDRVDDDIRVVAYDQETLDAAIQSGLEVR